MVPQGVKLEKEALNYVLCQLLAGILKLYPKKFRMKLSPVINVQIDGLAKGSNCKKEAFVALCAGTLEAVFIISNYGIKIYCFLSWIVEKSN